MQTKDLSKGKPLGLIFRFSLPMVLSVIFQQLYNIADSVIAGKMLGTDALAAVSASYPITMIYLGVGTGLSVGCGILMSRAYGKKDTNFLKTNVSTAFLTLFAVGIIMTFVGFFTAKPFLKLLNTPSEIFDDAAGYLRVYTLGMLFVYIYNACSVAFQSLGNSKIPLFFLIFSTVFNVGLDILFLLPQGARVSALSTATVIAQGIAAVGSVLVLTYLIHGIGRDNVKVNIFKKAAIVFTSLFKLFTFKKDYKIIEGKIVYDIVTMGIPNVLQMSTVSIGQLFIQNLINGYGTNVIAAYGAGIKVSTFFINILTAQSNAASIFISQNVGAGTHKRIKVGIVCGFFNIFVSTIVIVTVGVLLSSQLISLFVEGDASAEVISIGSKMLIIIIPFYFVVIFKFISDALLKGSGAVSGFVVSTLVDLVVRVVGAYVMVHFTGNVIGIWWSWPLGWVAGAIVSLIFSFSGIWRKKIKPFERPELQEDIIPSAED